MIDQREELERSAAHRVALDALTAGIAAADPARLTRERVSVSGSRLSVGESAVSLDDYETLRVLGGGKAAGVVAAELEAILDDRLDGGVVVTNEPVDAERVDQLPGDHPVPGASSLKSSRRLLSAARDAGEETLVLAVITGGGSALMAAPAEGLSLADLQSTTQSLLDSGATIDEINAVRKHCSAIKGGQLAAATAPARVECLLVSDVVGNDLGTIASGPFVGDASTYDEALAVLDRYDCDVPQAVRRRIEAGAAGEIAETPGPDDPVFDRVSTTILGDNAVALEAAAEAAREAGFEPLLLSSRIRGEAREAAKTGMAIAEEMRATGEPLDPPAAVVSGGETTVTVRGDGTGGPNQEFALSAALECDESGVVVAAIDTDGIDGPTDAAGAVVDCGTVEDGAAAAALANNDAYSVLEAADALVRTGPTGTNVNDLRIVVVQPDSE
ncbi:glycerate kinase type-2 family protein [Halohasta salina]|uniref:glycerate kinase type-2 family protein n=1 Tax=Halohasta salina TaxID=2961621 RepID=UPI0020A44B47|nr:DUF4147 domain-containing protein [Halohasta salina]